MDWLLQKERVSLAELDKVLWKGVVGVVCQWRHIEGCNQGQSLFPCKACLDILCSSKIGLLCVGRNIGRSSYIGNAIKKGVTTSQLVLLYVCEEEMIHRILLHCSVSDLCES